MLSPGAFVRLRDQVTEAKRGASIFLKFSARALHKKLPTKGEFRKNWLRGSQLLLTDKLVI